MERGGGGTMRALVKLKDIPQVSPVAGERIHSNLSLTSNTHCGQLWITIQSILPRPNNNGKNTHKQKNRENMSQVCTMRLIHHRVNPLAGFKTTFEVICSKYPFYKDTRRPQIFFTDSCSKLN